MNEVKVIEAGPGEHISAVAARAVKEAESGCVVSFLFNGTTATAAPGETVEQVESRWSRDMEAAGKAYRESPEYIEREKQRADEHAARLAAHLTESASTEQEMRDAKSPWPYTMEQLTEYVNSLTDRQHDYGTCVYAMSLAATAAFNFVAHKLGVTGFQSSCADLDFIKRARHIEGPFMLIKGGDALYPQYDLPGKLAEAMEEWKPWLKEEAIKNLAESPVAHSDVIAHWKRIAEVKQ